MNIFLSFHNYKKGLILFIFLELAFFCSCGHRSGMTSPQTSIGISNMVQNAKGVHKEDFPAVFSPDHTMSQTFSESLQGYEIDQSLSLFGESSEKIVITYGSDNIWAETKYIFIFPEKNPQYAFEWMKKVDKDIRDTFMVQPAYEDFFTQYTDYSSLVQSTGDQQAASFLMNTYTVGDNLRIDMRGIFTLDGQTSAVIRVWDGTYDPANKNYSK